jgi:hypothetical protein
MIFGENYIEQLSRAYFYVVLYVYMFLAVGVTTMFATVGITGSYAQVVSRAEIMNRLRDE